MEYLISADLEVPGWPVKGQFLEKVKTIVKAGIKSWFAALDLAGVIPFWLHLCFNKFQ